MVRNEQIRLGTKSFNPMMEEIWNFLYVPNKLYDSHGNIIWDQEEVWFNPDLWPVNYAPWYHGSGYLYFP